MNFGMKPGMKPGKPNFCLNLNSAECQKRAENEEFHTPGSKNSTFTLKAFERQNASKKLRADLKANQWVLDHTAPKKNEFPKALKIFDNSKQGQGFILRVTVHRDKRSVYKTFYLQSTAEGVDLQSKLKELVMREVTFQLIAHETVAKDDEYMITDEHGINHKIRIPELQSVWVDEKGAVAQLKMEHIEFDEMIMPTKKMYDELEHHYSDSFYHNDFNSGNFKYDGEGNLVLLDFGSGDFIKNDRKGGRRTRRGRKRNRLRKNSSFR
jgi:hypothetical protein